MVHGKQQKVKSTYVDKFEREWLIDYVLNSDVAEDDRERLNTCIASSESIWAGGVDGKLVCVWGLCPPTLLADRAYLWLYTTDNLKTNEFLFVRKSQLFIQEALKTYNVIYGVTDPKKPKTLRWLKWLGATLTPSGGPLWDFEIRKH